MGSGRNQGARARAVLEHGETRALALALRLLYKVSAECTLEFRGDRLMLRALNGAQSAFAKVTLPASFFRMYGLRAPGQCDNLLLGVALKLLLHALRLFQAAEEVTLAYDEPEGGDMPERLNVHVLTRDGVRRTYGLPLLNQIGAATDANFELTNMDAVLEVRAKEFNRVQMASFAGSVTELTLGARKDQHAAGGSAATLRSHAEAKAEAADMLGTELSLHGDDESVLEIKTGKLREGEQAEATVALRELKAMLVFCESVGMDAALGFSEPGTPLVVMPRPRASGPGGPGTVAGCMGFSAQLVLSSLQQRMLATGRANGAAMTGDGTTGGIPPSNITGERAPLATTATASGSRGAGRTMSAGPRTQAATGALLAMNANSPAGRGTAGPANTAGTGPSTGGMFAAPSGNVGSGGAPLGLSPSIPLEPAPSHPSQQRPASLAPNTAERGGYTYEPEAQPMATATEDDDEDVVPGTQETGATAPPQKRARRPRRNHFAEAEALADDNEYDDEDCVPPSPGR